MMSPASSLFVGVCCCLGVDTTCCCCCCCCCCRSGVWIRFHGTAGIVSRWGLLDPSAHSVSLFLSLSLCVSVFLSLSLCVSLSLSVSLFVSSLGVYIYIFCLFSFRSSLKALSFCRLSLMSVLFSLSLSLCLSLSVPLALSVSLLVLCFSLFGLIPHFRASFVYDANRS